MNFSFSYCETIQLMANEIIKALIKFIFYSYKSMNRGTGCAPMEMANDMLLVCKIVMNWIFRH